MEAFLGTIMSVGFNYAPKGWAFCNGQLLSITQNSALFSLLGVMYGGNGQVNFGIPDLRGRVPVGSQAAGPGLQNVPQGQLAGTNNTTVLGNGQVQVSLNSSNLPAHSHDAAGLTAATTMQASGTASGGSLAPAEGSLLVGTSTGSAQAAAIYLPTTSSPASPVNLGNLSTTVSGQTANAGNGAVVVAPVITQAVAPIMQPYLGLNFIISLYGVYPSRN